MTEARPEKGVNTDADDKELLISSLKFDPSELLQALLQQPPNTETQCPTSTLKFSMELTLHDKSPSRLKFSQEHFQEEPPTKYTSTKKKVEAVKRTPSQKNPTVLDKSTQTSAVAEKISKSPSIQLDGYLPNNKCDGETGGYPAVSSQKKGDAAKMQQETPSESTIIISQSGRDGDTRTPYPTRENSTQTIDEVSSFLFEASKQTPGNGSKHPAVEEAAITKSQIAKFKGRSAVKKSPMREELSPKRKLRSTTKKLKELQDKARNCSLNEKIESAEEQLRENEDSFAKKTKKYANDKVSAEKTSSRKQSSNAEEEGGDQGEKEKVDMDEERITASSKKIANSNSKGMKIGGKTPKSVRRVASLEVTEGEEAEKITKEALLSQRKSRKRVESDEDVVEKASEKKVHHNNVN